MTSIDPESLSRLMESFCMTWFRCFKSLDAIKDGTLNEVPAADVF